MKAQIEHAIFNIESILYLSGGSLTPMVYETLVLTVNDLKKSIGE